MRSRNIKPGFFKNEVLAKCHPYSQLLFIGLWQLADREGRLEYRPDKIYAEVFPYKTPELALPSTVLAPYKHHAVPSIAYLVAELIENEFLQPYIANGIEYLAILNFNRHQNPHKNEAQSTIPKPPEFISKKTRSFESVVKNHCEYGASTIQAQCEYGANPADSLLRKPESSIYSASDDAAQKPLPEETPPPEKSYTTKKGHKLTGRKLETFEQFWEAFAYRKGKAEAAEEWYKLSSTINGNLDHILSAAKREAMNRPAILARGSTPKMAQGWLSGRRWEDYQEEEAPKAAEIYTKARLEDLLS